jgi:phytoene synthase
MQDPFGHCEQLVRTADKDRFLASLFAPAQRRGALFALYAFNVEVARVAEVVRDPMAGEIRLQWWRDALERPAAGEAAANPVASALLASVVRYRLPIKPLMDLVEARAFDLYRDPMPTMAALEAYAHRTSSPLIDMAARILEARRDDMTAIVHHAGLAYALTALLRAFPLHASRGRLYVPLEILARHEARPEDVLAGRATPALTAALAEMRRIAQQSFEGYRTAAAAIPPAAAPAFLPVALVPLDLARLARARDPLAPVAGMAQWRRQWALWRAARRL